MREETAVGKPGGLGRIRLEQLAGVATLAGAATYAVLFVSYQSYYRQLGLRPEDVGVNQLFVLSRSLGFLAVLMLLATYATAVATTFPTAVGATDWMNYRDIQLTLPRRRTYARRGAAVAVLSLFLFWWVGGVQNLFGSQGRFHAFGPIVDPLILASTIGFTVLLLVMSFSRVAAWPRQGLRRLVIALLLPAVTLGLIVGLTTHARDLGQLALEGELVAPVMFLGLPLLDVETTAVHVEWTSASNHAPVGLRGPGGTCATLVGQDGTVTMLVLLGGTEEGVLLQTSSAAVSLSARSDRC